MLKPFTVAALITAATLTATPAVAATNGYAPEVSSGSITGAPIAGETLTAVFTGFNPDEIVTVTADQFDIEPSEVQPSPDGTVTVNVTIPPLPEGTHGSIDVTSNQTGHTASVDVEPVAADTPRQAPDTEPSLITKVLTTIAELIATVTSNAHRSQN